MRYALLNHFDESALAGLPAEVVQAQIGRFIAYTQALAASGVLRGAEQLQPSPATTTVRVRDGETLLHDGPLAELTEVFGGWWIVEVPDLDTALKHAADCPGAEFGAIEVRPLVELG